MTNGPDVPLITLTNGQQRVAIFDPRENPLALGARYVLGGYIAAWWCAERELTGRAKPAWDPFDGCGLPDCHEWGLGFAETPVGEAYLRLGAGQRIRSAADRLGEARGTLSSACEWTITSQGTDHLTCVTTDRIQTLGDLLAYRMERSVILHADGPEVRTTLELDCRWAESLNWFAHPFIAHHDGAGTRIQLPAAARFLSKGRTIAAPSADACTWRGAPEGGFAVAVGLWGQTADISFACDQRRGGGSVAMCVDKPLDRIVLWASPRVASAEPYWTRTWQNGEQSTWSVRYRFTPQA